MMRTILLLLPALAWGAVDGVVVNRTTGKPQPGATVTLIRLGNAMSTAGSAKTDAQGRFQLAEEFQAGAPHLIQVLHQDVTYNTMISPGSASTGLELPVYDAAANAPDAKVTQHMILLEPGAEGLAVSESVIYANTGNVTWNRPDGTLRMSIPDSANGVRVSIQAPQGMPVQRPPEKGKEPATYVVRYPIKPGETRIDFNYTLPASQKFDSRILHGGGPVRIVAPQGVTLEGPAVSSLGNEPRTNATIYEVSGTQYAVNITGTGSLRAAAAAGAEASGAEGEEDPSGGIDQAKPRIYKRLTLVLALAFGMLAIGFVLLYRTDPPAGHQA